MKDGPHRKFASKDEPAAFDAAEMANQIIGAALGGFRELLMSPIVTEFDRVLLDYQHEQLYTGKAVEYAPQEWSAMDPRRKKIITARLRLLGYQFNPVTSAWTKKYQKSLCDRIQVAAEARK